MLLFEPISKPFHRLISKPIQCVFFNSFQYLFQNPSNPTHFELLSPTHFISSPISHFSLWASKSPNSNPIHFKLSQVPSIPNLYKISQIPCCSSFWFWLEETALREIVEETALRKISLSFLNQGSFWFPLLYFLFIYFVGLSWRASGLPLIE